MTTLETLLADLEKAASQHTAPAASAIEKPAISQELDALLTKEAAADNVAKAFEDGEKLARAVLEKLASEALSEQPAAVTEAAAVEAAPADETQENTATAVTESQTEENMNKQATEAGQDLAQSIIEKLADFAGNGTVAPVPPAVNKIQQDAATMIQQHSARIGPTPGTNGTVTQVFDAIVAKAKALGAGGLDQGSGAAPHDAAVAKDPALGTPAIPPSPDSVEKQAAVTALIDAGLDWDSAVELVKSAAEEIATEELGQVKLAAVDQLMKDGFNFEDAVNSVNAAVTELGQSEQE